MDGNGVVIVVLPDEIDIANAGVIGDRLRDAIDSGTPAVIADMTATTFCDAAGFRALLQARRHAAGRSVQFGVACASAAVLRVRGLLGLDEQLHVSPSVGAALASLRGIGADAARRPGSRPDHGGESRSRVLAAVGGGAARSSS